MITFIAPYKEDHFSTNDEKEEKRNIILNTFNLPFPEKLKVTLSFESVQRITYLYRFMIEQHINKMDFYIRSGEDFNSFEPVNNDICFETNNYIDFGEVLFNTFNTQTSRVILNRFYETITFMFLYNNSWTEELFEYTYSIKDITEKK